MSESSGAMQMRDINAAIKKGILNSTVSQYSQRKKNYMNARVAAQTRKNVDPFKDPAVKEKADAFRKFIGILDQRYPLDRTTINTPQAIQALRGEIKTFTPILNKILREENKNCSPENPSGCTVMGGKSRRRRHGGRSRKSRRCRNKTARRSLRHK